MAASRWSSETVSPGQIHHPPTQIIRPKRQMTRASLLIRDGCVEEACKTTARRSAAVMMEPVMEFQWGHLPEVDGGESYRSQRAVIALSWPAGAGADGTATSVNITSRWLDVPNATSALHGIKLKSKLKCFFFLFFFLGPLQYYWPGANTLPGFISHHSGLCLLWLLNRLWTLSPPRAKLVF